MSELFQLLPSELLAKLHECGSLTLDDWLSLASTCKALRHLVFRRVPWRHLKHPLDADSLPKLIRKARFSCHLCGNAMAAHTIVHGVHQGPARWLPTCRDCSSLSLLIIPRTLEPIRGLPSAAPTLPEPIFPGDSFTPLRVYSLKAVNRVREAWVRLALSEFGYPPDHPETTQMASEIVSHFAIDAANILSWKQLRETVRWLAPTMWFMVRAKEGEKGNGRICLSPDI